jgi:hypothetical protein
VLGDSTFFDTLAMYRERHAFATATTEDLRAVAEEVWGGDLEWFFDQWVYGGGAPSYRFAWQEHEIGGQRYLELMLEQTQSGGVFEMPVDIAIHTSGGDEDRSVWNRAPLEHHLLPVGDAVDSVELDPQEWILSRLVEESFFTPGPPKIVSVSPPPAAVLPAGRTLAMEIVFHRDVVVDGTEFTLRRADGRAVEIVVGYDPASHTATVASRGPLAGGRYRLVIDDTLLGAADGLALDGEVGGLLPSGDGVPGGDAVLDFAVLGTRSPDRRVSTAR